MSDTIFALSSGPPPAGVAVIRVSGLHVPSVSKRMLGLELKPRKATLVSVKDPSTGELIDRGLGIYFEAGASFTGEPVLELHLHGGRAVIRRALTALAEYPGLRPAKAGEFTRRAFLHGKVDLLSAEGLADLVSADTEAQRILALRQISGVFSSFVAGWRQELIEIASTLASVLDFSDEGDVDVSMCATVAERCGALSRHMQSVLTGRASEIVRDGFTVLLAGPPNAGKSSVLNALAKRDIAIVSPYAGTTRDAIEVTLDLDGFPVRVIDTAGIRETIDPVEQIGISRTLAKSHVADLVFWLSEDQREPPHELAHSIRIRSKRDLAGSNISGLAVSVLQENGLDDLINLISSHLAVLDVFSPAVANERQRAHVRAAMLTLQEANDEMMPEILAEVVRFATKQLDELLGHVDVELVLDAVFARFCIGK